MSTREWEAVIGLEVHVELATRTKLFCRCPNEFGAEPNTNVCPVCLGLPGSLPVLNEQAVDYALRLGEALGFDPPARSIFARKNYFYPDMPKDYQISQYEEPVLLNGRLAVEHDGERVVVRIQRAHLEEDTGKTTHVGGRGRIHDADYSLVDYNRAGIPLMEVVSEPDLRSADHARAYVTELRSVLQALGVSDVRMEEGSLRIDANISVRRAGSGPTDLGTKVEIKNMNSLRSVGRALEYERGRQVALLSVGEAVVQETRHWDEDDGCTRGMRTKEGSSDYRYFPDPDLVPLVVTPVWRERVRAALPELPAARRARLVSEWGISGDEARVLEASGLAGFAESAVEAGAAPAAVVNWVTGDVLAFVNETGAEPAQLRLAPAGLAELVALVDDGTLSRNMARDVLQAVLAEGGRPAGVAAARGLAQVSDEAELAGLVERVLEAHPEEAQRYRTGDEKARKRLHGFFMGRLMVETKGQGNPQVLTRLLEGRLGA